MERKEGKGKVEGERAGDLQPLSSRGRLGFCRVCGQVLTALCTCPSQAAAANESAGAVRTPEIERHLVETRLPGCCQQSLK